MNDRGQAVGLGFKSWDARDGAHRALLWERGRTRDLGSLGGRGSAATAINERGQIVGTSATRSGKDHPFVWENGRMTDLGTLPGTTSSSAVAINDRGVIVGTSIVGDNTRAVIWTRR